MTKFSTLLTILVGLSIILVLRSLVSGSSLGAQQEQALSIMLKDQNVLEDRSVSNRLKTALIKALVASIDTTGNLLSISVESLIKKVRDLFDLGEDIQSAFGEIKNIIQNTLGTLINATNQLILTIRSYTQEVINELIKSLKEIVEVIQKLISNLFKLSSSIMAKQNFVMDSLMKPTLGSISELLKLNQNMNNQMLSTISRILKSNENTPSQVISLVQLLTQKIASLDSLVIENVQKLSKQDKPKSVQTILDGLLDQVNEMMKSTMEQANKMQMETNDRIVSDTGLMDSFKQLMDTLEGLSKKIDSIRSVKA